MQPEKPFLIYDNLSNSSLMHSMKVLRNQREALISIRDDYIDFGGQKVKLADAIGVVPINHEDQRSKKGSRTYSLFSFPRRKKLLRSQKRCLEQIQFEVTDTLSWVEFESILISVICNRSPEQTKKLLICFNPNAGSNSENHLQTILTFISRTNLKPQVFTTEYRNHCIEYLKTINVSEYCGVAIVSGDGLMHQYVNSFVDLPVTHVPAGSGNAFAKTQMETAGELCRDEESIFLVVKNRVKEFNIVKYELQNLPNPIYSFLSLEWAIIADLDMNSEFLRCLGGLRFDIYAVYRCLKMLRYQGRVSYSTTLSSLPPLSTQLSICQDIKIVSDTFLHAIFCSIPYISDKNKMAPAIKNGEQLIDLQLLRQRDGRWQLIKYLLNSASGSHYDIDNQRPAQGFSYLHDKVKCFRLEPMNEANLGIFGIDGERYEAQRIQGSLSEKKFKVFV